MCLAWWLEYSWTFFFPQCILVKKKKGITNGIHANTDWYFSKSSIWCLPLTLLLSLLIVDASQLFECCFKMFQWWTNLFRRCKGTIGSMTSLTAKIINYPFQCVDCVLDVGLYLMTRMWTSNFYPIIEVSYLTGRKVLRASSDDIHFQNAVVCNLVDFWICFPLAHYSLYFFYALEVLIANFSRLFFKFLIAVLFFITGNN